MNSQEIFECVVKRVFKEEGLYSNDPKDRGGETKFGISKRSFPDVDIFNLTKPKAKDLYYEHFWKNSNLHKIRSLEMVGLIFSIGIHCGMGPPIKSLQRAVRAVNGKKLSVDGILGPITIFKVNEILEEVKNDRYNALFSATKSHMAAYYRSLESLEYEKGWLNRAYADYDYEK